MTELSTITVTVNGQEHRAAVEPRTTLGDFLRAERLTGTHLGCEQGVCGACTVLFDGDPMRSCLLLAVQADGHDVQTVESLELPDGSLNPLQAAFQQHHGLQCGFCTPGILMSLTAMLNRDPHPTEGHIRDVIQGHLCRCTGYQQMIEATMEVAGLEVPDAAAGHQVSEGSTR